MKRPNSLLLYLNCILVLFICLPANHAYARTETYTQLRDTTLVMGNKGQLRQVPFSYQTSFLYPSGKRVEFTDSLTVNLRLPTGYAGFKPHPMSNPDFVFFRFSIFNREDLQKK